jgi:hypothetical protein
VEEATHQANVDTVTFDRFYCFTGLPTARGGQVTVDFVEQSPGADAQFGFSNAGCENFVVIHNAAGNRILRSFFLLFY